MKLNVTTKLLPRLITDFDSHIILENNHAHKVQL